jgi:hypothetical protein
MVIGLTTAFPAQLAAAPRSPAPARSVPAVDRSALAGSWNGTWTGENNVYNAVMTLDMAGRSQTYGFAMEFHRNITMPVKDQNEKSLASFTLRLCAFAVPRRKEIRKKIRSLHSPIPAEPQQFDTAS